MPKNLEELLQEIDPSNTIDKFETRINRFLSNYQIKNIDLTKREDIDRCLAVFTVQASRAASNRSMYDYDDEDLKFAIPEQYLRDKYGSIGTVYEIIRTGAEGGLYTILRDLAQSMANKFGQNVISAKVNHFCCDLSYEEHVAAAEEYLEKYRDMLPRDAQENIRVKAFFSKVLEDHPYILKRMRDR